MDHANNKHAGWAGTALIASAAALAVTAILVRQQGLNAERRHPPIGRFMTVGSVRLHYVDRGEGPPLIMLHGNGSMVEDFDSSGLLDRLARQHRVIAVDRPGFGYSDRPRDRVWTAEEQAAIVRDLADRLGLRRPIVLGHSWGTLVALAYALDDPDAVGGLALLSGYYYPTARADVPLFVPPAIPVVGDAMRYTVSPVVGRMIGPGLIRTMFAPDPVPGRFDAEYSLAMALRPWQIRASAEDTADMIPAAARFQHRYAGLRVPTLVAAGEDDRIVDPAAHAERLAAELPTARLLLLPGIGHMAHHFAAARIVDELHALTRQRLPA